jgi:hypothetical protein
LDQRAEGVVLAQELHKISQAAALEIWMDIAAGSWTIDKDSQLESIFEIFRLWVARSLQPLRFQVLKSIGFSR